MTHTGQEDREKLPEWIKNTHNELYHYLWRIKIDTFCKLFIKRKFDFSGKYFTQRLMPKILCTPKYQLVDKFTLAMNFDFNFQSICLSPIAGRVSGITFRTTVHTLLPHNLP